MIGLGLAGAGVVPAQYPGQVSKKSSDKAPELRAVAVLEWTGDREKPSASRIVPISIFDGEHLQDAGLYLAHPMPLAVSGDIEYELKENGRTTGLFDVKRSGQVMGSWVGFGDLKAVPKPKTEAGASAKIDEDWNDDDKPVLHRKHKEDASAKPGGTDGSKDAPAQDDGDRPKLHKKADDSAASGSSADPDRPRLHQKTGDSGADKSGEDKSGTDQSASSAPVDPDRPTMKKPKAKAAEIPADAEGNVSSLPDVSDPDRPRLQHGKSAGSTVKVEPTLMGLPAEMQQAVAVSDAHNRPEHPWTYSWANPGDEAKMRAQLEDTARQALGIAQPAPAQAKTPTTHARSGAHRGPVGAKAATAAAVEPAPLEDEQFRVFELAYGSGATLVLTAHSSGAPADQKFVTLIAQPDLYGNVRVLLKSVTDSAHLDETPRMRLVDAVDALADNRGELLFELRGDTTRQFALYRILRGRADKLFTTFGGNMTGTATE
ncbi:MAG TPA: hypothetical protein VGL22_08270 [Terracidiphilus sp.]